MKIRIQDLAQKMQELLLKAGMNPDNAEKVTDVFMRATYRGVGHHDVADLVNRVRQLQEKSINPNPNYNKISGFGAIECYDGDNALGELNSYFVTEKSMELA
jgi:3-dehydro-L-gulonate 2-dehydrogenase